MPNKHSKRTMYKNLVKEFQEHEVEVANIIMNRMGSWDTKKAFANEIKSLYLYAAREVINYLEKIRY